ncbi:ATP-binding domain-containing protein [Mesorhizobium sp. M0134]|uniref:DEAD/DEAH box helicase n=1 Tax=Mesorhizobium sp. M0134 TaxID=2956889 RepID=UPI00333748DB
MLEGAKALSRPKPRNIKNPEIQRPAAALLKLELDIANFDQRQRRAALVNIDGPQRIRGLAGSGKTIILAMKAAHLHLTKPSERILVTFYTRSLYASLKGLITRFFRNFKDEDPDWTKIHIRHGWGGFSRAGTYADACAKHGIPPLTFPEAQKGAMYMRAKMGERIDPFDFACRDLIARVQIRPQYDHILIDEGQDFPSGFYELCFGLAAGERDKKNIVWAYDELQNILDIQIRTPDQLFGLDRDGQPRISLPRAGANLPVDTDNDTILRKCYRNQREVLVTAHALGFGIYNNIVQMLESREHWEDVGYDVLTPGPLVVGQPVLISRPPTNSPLNLSTDRVPPTIECHIAPNFEAEGRWIAEQVTSFIEGGLQPEDLLVIALDDKAAKSYFRKLSSLLSEAGIASNNITADPYNEPPFTLPGKVTLSTVYRAKGNEAAVVFAAGVDAVTIASRSGRNKLFTAFTRTKAWLRVSGVGANASVVCKEIQTALANFPNLSFVMPNLRRVDTIQRDLNQRSIKAKQIREEYLGRLQAEGFEIDEAADLLSLEDPDE